MSTLTVSLIQTNLFWEDSASNLNHLEEKINGIQEKTELVVLPEMFTTGFSMQPELLAEPMSGNSVNWMKRIAASKKIVLTGSMMVTTETGYFNRLMWVLPNGTVNYYNKRHLFGYAGENKFYTPGNKRVIASLKGWKINLLVCYDLRFPVWSRQQSEAAPEYDVLLYVANWPEKRIHAWDALLTARAIENQCYVVGVNRVGEDGNGIIYNGHSMILDPLGNKIYQAPPTADIHTIVLEKETLMAARERFPFWKDGDNFQIIQSNEADAD